MVWGFLKLSFQACLVIPVKLMESWAVFFFSSLQSFYAATILNCFNSSWPGFAYMRHEKQPSFPYWRTYMRRKSLYFSYRSRGRPTKTVSGQDELSTPTSPWYHHIFHVNFGFGAGPCGRAGLSANIRGWLSIPLTGTVWGKVEAEKPGSAGGYMGTLGPCLM